jgi:hypothetical protein
MYDSTTTSSHRGGKLEPRRDATTFQPNRRTVKGISEYWEKAQTAKLKYCQDHDREYYDFEGDCPICQEEESYAKIENVEIWDDKIFELD